MWVAVLKKKEENQILSLEALLLTQVDSSLVIKKQSFYTTTIAFNSSFLVCSTEKI